MWRGRRNTTPERETWFGLLVNIKCRCLKMSNEHPLNIQKCKNNISHAMKLYDIWLRKFNTYNKSWYKAKKCFQINSSSCIECMNHNSSKRTWEALTNNGLQNMKRLRGLQLNSPIKKSKSNRLYLYITAKPKSNNIQCIETIIADTF